LHILNILKEKELEESSVVKDYLTTAEDYSVVRKVRTTDKIKRPATWAGPER